MSATYYFSPAGDDANDGRSPATAWQSLARLNAHAHAAGDTYLFEGRATFAGALEIWNVGDPVHPILLASHGVGRATIQSGTSRGLWYSGPGGLHVRGLVFQGDGVTTNDVPGIDLINHGTYYGPAANLLVEDVEVCGYGLAGISIQPGDHEIEGVQIRHCHLHHNANGLMVAHGEPGRRLLRNLHITHVHSHDNTSPRPELGMAGIGIVAMNVSGGTLERCLVHGNGANTPAPGHNGIMVEFSDHVTVQHNEVHNNRDTGWGDGQGIVLNALVDSVAQYNYTHGNDNSGIHLMGERGDSRGVTLRYNISENDGVGVTVWQSVWDAEIHNNTIFSSIKEGGFRACLTLMEWQGSASLRNNLLVTEHGAVHLQADAVTLRNDVALTLQGNCYYNVSGGEFTVYIIMGEQGYYTLDSWRRTSGQEMVGDVAVGSETDPGLVGLGKGGTLGVPDRLHQLAAYRHPPETAGNALGLDLGLFNVSCGPTDFFGTPLADGPQVFVGAAR